MGRQAYLMRLALGRSALEPLEPDELSRFQSTDIGDQIVQTDDPAGPLQLSQCTAGQHVQRYDERGHPIDPSLRASARAMRNAQNEVLAIVGVCERDAPRAMHRTPDVTPLSRLVKETADHRGLEDRRGNDIYLCAQLLYQFGGSRISAFLARLLVFRIPSSALFLGILRADIVQSGAYSFLLAGVPSGLAYDILTVALDFLIEYSTNALDQKLLAMRMSKRNLNRSHVSVLWLDRILKIFSQVALYPFLAYSNLQALYLISARSRYPLGVSFVPFSAWSPVQSLPLPSVCDLRSLSLWLMSGLSSPVIVHLICWGLSPYELTALRPPGMIDPNRADGLKEEEEEEVEEEEEEEEEELIDAELAGVQGNISVVRNLVMIRNGIFHLLGWTHARLRSSSSDRPAGNGNQLLPPSTEEAPLPMPVPLETTDHFHAQSLQPRRPHHVASLSTAPATYLIHQIDDHLYKILMIPFHAIMLRSLAINFLTSGSAPGANAAASPPVSTSWFGTSVYPPFGGPLTSLVLGKGGSIGDAAVYVSRIGLCCAMQVAFGFVLWGCQWGLVRCMGKRWYGWGNL